MTADRSPRSPRGPREVGLVLGEHRLDGAIDRPPDGVIDRLGGVGLRRDLLEEEAREPRVVAPPVVPIDLRPALVGRQLVVERARPAYAGAAASGAARRRRTPRCPRRVPAARPRAGWPARRRRRRARRGRPLRRRGVHHGFDVLDEPLVRVGGRLGRPVRAAVAPPVEGHDPVGAAQEVDLRLPLARVDDRRRGQEHERRARPTRRRRRRGGRRRPRSRTRTRPAAARRRTPVARTGRVGAVSITSRSPGSRRSRGAAG